MTRSLPHENTGEPVRGDAKTILAASALPGPAKDLIAQVIRRTRLWRREKAAIAAELVAHFQDGVEAGRSAEDLIKTFGNAKTTAQLIRRSKKRNRPLWWRAARRVLQGLGVIILLYLGQMAILLSGRPEPKIDYAARLCEKAETIADADRAWPIYRQAWFSDDPSKIEWTPSKTEWIPSTQPVVSAYAAATMPATDPRRLARLAAIEARQRAERPLSDSHPGDPNWTQALAQLQKHSALLEAARAGGMKPGLGITLRERRGLEGTQYRTIFPRQDGTASWSWSWVPETLRDLDCRENGALTNMVKLLIIDLRWAASQQDAGRVVDDYRAILGMLSQIRETPTFIGQLLVVIYIQRSDQALADAVAQNPDLLSPQQYVELLHTMPSARDTIGVSTESLRAEMEELIQRMYTDDGSGDGRLTQEGAQYFLGQRDKVTQPPGHSSVASALTLPLLSAAIVSRREMTQVVQERYDLLEKRFHQPLRQQLLTGSDDDLSQSMLKMRASLLTSVHYWPLSVFIPQFTTVGMDMHIARARHDALTVALSLETYRRTNGSYPSNLDSLVPRYLPAVPLDPLADKPLLYTLRDGQPVIYARGRDGLDHGGVWTDKRIHGTSVPNTGDWVLYPPVGTD